jgi:Ca-activated chloride channel family protein
MNTTLAKTGTRGLRRATVSAVAAVFLGLSAAPVQAAGLLIADGGFGGVLEIVDHDVRVTINNGIAVTEVTQVFRNTENRQVEALYVFPVPKNASVANFSMWINGKEIIGEVLEKQRAREIYESYKQVRRDPGLLEQKDYRTFEMRIFPIGPGAEQRVQIAYYQELDFDHDWVTYVYPLATAVRPGIDANAGRLGFAMQVKSEVPLVAIESPSHGDQLVVVKHGETFCEASLEAHGSDLVGDIVVAYHVARPRTGLDLITSKPSGEDGYFLLTLTAGDELAEAARGMDYVFVLDVSGSMNLDDKLADSRDSVAAFVNGLGPEDRFDVITFNLAPTMVFGGLRTVDAAARDEALRFLNSQTARGGTSLRPALLTAYKYADPDRPLNVVVLSDGLTEQQEREQVPQLIQSRPAGTRVFCVGVGNDVDRGLLSQLAEDAGGLAAFLSGQDDLGRQAQAFRRKLLRPAADHLRISFEGAEVYDVEPKQLGSLYHGMPVRIYGRYRKAGPVNVHVQADVSGEPLDQTLQFDLPPVDDANPEIERMWAYKKVERLLREADKAGSRTAVVDEIVRLGELYSIVTEYTSFIVLENDAEYQRWRIQRRNLLRLGRDRQQQARMNERLAKMRDQSLARLSPESSRTPATEQVASKPDASSPRFVPNNGRGRDLSPTLGPSSRPSQGGGGALDPISAALLAALGGVGWAARRRRMRS